MESKNKLTNLAIIIAVGMFFGLLYFYLCVRYRDASYPVADFLYASCDRYMDFFNVNRMSEGLNPYNYIEFGSSYPPFIHIISYLFSLFAPYGKVDVFIIRSSSVPVYIGIFGVFSIILFLILLKQTAKIQKLMFWKKALCTLLLLFSVPYLFLLDRGNYLIISLIFYTLFAFSYEKKPTCAAICLGIAAAIKIYPAFIIILYLTEKKWKPFFVSLTTCGILSITPLFFFKGSLVENITSFIGNLFNFVGSGDPDAFQSFQIGLTGLIRLPFVNRTTGFSMPNLPLNEIFLVFVFLLIGLTIFFLLRRKTEFWEKLAFMTIVMLLIIPNSFLYNLTFLIPVIVLFILSDKKSSIDPCFILCFGLLFIPKSYYILYAENTVVVELQMILDPLLLLMLLYLLVLRRSETGLKIINKWNCCIRKFHANVNMKLDVFFNK